MDLNQNTTPSQNNSEDFNLKKILSVYTKQWLWFVLCLIAAIGVAFLYIRYTPPQYEAHAKIKFLDDEEGNTASAAFKELSMFADSENAKIEDEIEVAKSREIVGNVIKKLNLNIQYFIQGRIFESELYGNIPVKINFIASDSIMNKTNFNFYFEVLSDLEFNYKLNESDVPKKSTFGENIQTSFGGMVITPNDNNFKRLKGSTIRVQISSVSSLIPFYLSNISMSQMAKSSKIVRISMRDMVKSKAIDVINTLVDEYNIYSISKKNIRAKGTSEFIDERIDLIASELSRVDDNAENFKTGNKLTNVASEADMYLGSSSQSELEMNAARNELNVINYLKNQVGNSGSSFDAIPTNVGVSDPSIAATAAKYNELLNTRQARLKSSTTKNPIIVNLDQELNNLRESLKQSLDNSSNTIKIKVSNLQNQLQRINSKIYAVPGQTRKLRDIEREQLTLEELYVYLLTKKEEAAISLTATSPNAIVIDEAYANSTSVSPNKKLILIGSCFVGFLIPFLFIYVNDLLDSKIHNREDLNQVTKDITILGELPRLSSSEKTLIERNDRSILSEAFRIIRTNFDFVKRGRAEEKYNNVVFVTSTLSGEGKSFFSMNMAMTIANTGKKVLLIGADIRNPRINGEIANKKDKVGSKLGFTEFLADSSVDINDTINRYDINDIKIDILLSGQIPPNPAELLMSDRVKILFDSVSEKYDYVIVDTAPSMLVTDTLLISQYAGHTVYMSRADYTEKKLLNFAKDLHKEKKLKNMMFVVNDVKQSNFGYGAQYGYYATSNKKGFLGMFKKS